MMYLVIGPAAVQVRGHYDVPCHYPRPGRRGYDVPGH